jgi:glycogen debranching enzyme
MRGSRGLQRSLAATGSLLTLAFAPDLAAGTLRTLAAVQGRRHDPERDEEPGKILHELRHGEMAAT